MMKEYESAGSTLSDLVINTAFDYQSPEFQKIRQDANYKISKRLIENKDIQQVLRMLADT